MNGADSDKSLEEIRREKLERLKEAQQEQQSQDNQLRARLNQLEADVKQHLTKKALERYSNVKLAYPQKASQLVLVLYEAIRQGKQTINDDELKHILMLMDKDRREIRIKR